jgi:hypothetical protein
MAVHFVVTGFGEFHGVKRNPTQELVEWLDKRQRARGSSIATHATAAEAPEEAPASAEYEQQEAYKVLSCTVLEVSATAVCEFLERQSALLQAACSTAGRQPVVLLHLGVDNQVGRLLLQRAGTYCCLYIRNIVAGLFYVMLFARGRRSTCLQHSVSSRALRRPVLGFATVGGYAYALVLGAELLRRCLAAALALQCERIVSHANHIAKVQASCLGGSAITACVTCTTAGGFLAVSIF